MSPNPVGWFEIYVQDLKKATKFYESVFETKLEPLPSPMPEIEMMAFPMEMDRMGAPGALVKMDGMNCGGNSVLVYFSSEDCAIEEARIVAAGGKIQRPKTSIGPYGFIVLAFDTDGNMFGIHSR